MNNYKKIALALLTLPLIHGCSKDYNGSTKPTTSTINSEAHSNQEIKTEKKISKIEAEIYAELKTINATTYRALFGEATTDDNIAEYTKIKLLWVKIVSDTYGSKIRLSFDENLLELGECENFLDPIHHSVDYIAEKHKLFNPEVEIYVKDRSLYNDIWKKNIKALADKNKRKPKLKN